MSNEFSYRDYVTDTRFLGEYNEYQRKYTVEPRESDKVVMSLVRAIVDASPGRRLRLLDVGCSTGNLLLHLSRIAPEIELVGGDLAESSLEQCRANPALAGVEFVRLDLLDIPAGWRFDIVVVNAVLTLLSDSEFERAMASVACALNPCGRLLVFDYFHPFGQHISILEKTASHPDGVALHFRPYSMVRDALANHGLEAREFLPFTPPIDLPRPDDDANIITYTLSAADGRRLPFRGTLFQPWCHLVASKNS